MYASKSPDLSKIFPFDDFFHSVEKDTNLGAWVKQLLEPGTVDMNHPNEFIPTRSSLLSRLKDSGDNDGWQEFFDTYWKLIYNAAVRSGLTEAEAQDVVQETVIAIWKKIPEFVYDPAKGSFKTWLMRQTTWRIAGQLRKRMPVERLRRDPSTADGTTLLERVPDPATSALETSWNQDWEQNLLQAALSRVKAKVEPRQYQVFDVVFHNKWSVPQAAEMFRISKARVYLIRHRVGRILKKELLRLGKHPL